MREAQTVLVKYVFVDIVGYTKGRSVEAQTEIIDVLNRVVLDALQSHKIQEEQRILIPTGDGMCIALPEVMQPFDIHLELARAILSQINAHNTASTDETRKFAVRIGLNENVDNLITDVNGRKNVAGMGINMAQRIMDQGDGGHILVSESVFTTLRGREKYLKSFRTFGCRTKHGDFYKLYQYLDNDAPGLNLEEPAGLISPRAPKLTDTVAYYFAFAAKFQTFLIAQLHEHENRRFVAIVLLSLRALDCFNKAKSQGQATQVTWGADEKKTFEEQMDHYLEVDWPLIRIFSGLFVKEELEKFHKFFIVSDSRRYFCLLNRDGFQKLKLECPDIWKAFQLDDVIPPTE